MFQRTLLVSDLCLRLLGYLTGQFSAHCAPGRASFSTPSFVLTLFISCALARELSPHPPFLDITFPVRLLLLQCHLLRKLTATHWLCVAVLTPVFHLFVLVPCRYL